MEDFVFSCTQSSLRIKIDSNTTASLATAVQLALAFSHIS